jgi:hypothetical protein
VDVISLEFVMKMAERTIYAGHSAISLQWLWRVEWVKWSQAYLQTGKPYCWFNVLLLIFSGSIGQFPKFQHALTDFIVVENAYVMLFYLCVCVEQQ